VLAAILFHVGVWKVIAGLSAAAAVGWVADIARRR
jgi:hypothetical protein